MIYLILILGFLLRLISSNQSLWLDEAINVLGAKNTSLWQFLTSYSISDFHPPLYFGILWIWSHIFGINEIVLRLPSIALGVGAIYFTYLIGKDLFSKKVGLLSALILAVNPLHLYYSQEVRMYSLSAFSVVLSFYFLIKLFSDKKWFWLYSLSVAICLYSDYLAYLIIPAQIIFVLLWKREKVKDIVLGQVVGSLFLIPWIFILPKQLSVGIQTAQAVPGWKAVVGGSSFKDLALIFIKSIVGRVSFSNKVLYGFVVGIVGLFYGSLVMRVLRRIDEKVKLIVCWILIPIIMAFLISFFTPVLSYFRMIYIVPAFCLLLGLGLSHVGKKWFYLSLIVLISINLGFITAYYLNPDFQREDWRDLAKFTNSQNSNNSLVLLENNDVIAPYRFYDSKNVQSLGALKNFPANSINDLINIDEVTKNKSDIFLVDYLVGISDPNRAVDRRLTGLGFRVIKVYNFPAVGFVYEYQK